MIWYLLWFHLFFILCRGWKLRWQSSVMCNDWWEYIVDYYFVEWAKWFCLYFVLVCHIAFGKCWESTSLFYYHIAFVSNSGTAVSGRCLDNYYVIVCAWQRISNRKCALRFGGICSIFARFKDGCALCLWTSTLLKVENKWESLSVMGGNRIGLCRDADR